MATKTTVHIDDDFDLEKIKVSGQCFRVRALEDGTYKFITKNHVLFIRDIGNNDFEISCDLDEWKQIWFPYFDLERNYSSIRACHKNKNAFIDKAINCGQGLRILSQDPWEMLISFIISQRKSIPAITTAIETLSKMFGEKLDDDTFAFPTQKALASASESDLRKCGLGYRAPYVMDAAQKVINGIIDLNAIKALSDEELLDTLQTVHGVGKKVSRCVALFGYARYALVPVDVWIERVIQNECEGCDPFPEYGNVAGIMQQYAFFYMTNTYP